MEATQVSINSCMDKTTVGHLHNVSLLSHMKEENFTLFDSMNGLENVMLSEMSQSEKEKYHMTSLLHAIYWTTDGKQ